MLHAASGAPNPRLRLRVPAACLRQPSAAWHVAAPQARRPLCQAPRRAFGVFVAGNSKKHHLRGISGFTVPKAAFLPVLLHPTAHHTPPARSQARLRCVQACAWSACTKPHNQYRAAPPASTQGAALQSPSLPAMPVSGRLRLFCSAHTLLCVSLPKEPSAPYFGMAKPCRISWC